MGIEGDSLGRRLVLGSPEGAMLEDVGTADTLGTMDGASEYTLRLPLGITLGFTVGELDMAALGSMLGSPEGAMLENVGTKDALGALDGASEYTL